jgi:molybdopterin-guanine dinucleotide biosynthesis protein A
MLLPPYSAVILAGGVAQRLGGGDKPLRQLGDRTILSWIIERIDPQVQHLALSANGDANRFSDLNLPVLPDRLASLGPMAGVLSAMEWTKRNNPEASHVLTLSGDTPFIPRDLVQNLAKIVDSEQKMIASASSAGRPHPTISFWPIAAFDQITDAILNDKGRRVLDWLTIFHSRTVEWDHQPFDPFFNINTPDDLREAEKIMILARSPLV